MAASKRLQPTVIPKTTEVLEEGQETPESIQQLPPIAHIKPPVMKHTSTKIRWYLGLGFTVKEVSDWLGVRYQQVRNVGVQTPKRAAREDVPPYIIELWEVDDDLEAMDKHAMEQQMAVSRAESRAVRKAIRQRKAGDPFEEPNGDTNTDAEVDEITEQEDPEQ